jgi:riboflavin kinase
MEDDLMKPYLLQTLKELALLGAIKNKIEISSFELAKQLETSQQTASRYLVELDKKGMITRELGIKKQLIMVTGIGEEILQEEHLQYKQIFELTDRIIFKGKVVSGLGEGRYYTEQDGYTDQFKQKLGFVPYPGTLNVEIEYVERNKLRLLKNSKSIDIDEFKTKNRTFGSVRCFKAKINASDGAIVLPLRTHYSSVLELISQDNLRENLNLKDGDEVKIVIYFEN